MPKARRKWVWLPAALFVAGGLSVLRYVRLPRANFYSALAATREWARVVEFPSSAENVAVKVTGSMFTRGFSVTFTAPLQDINDWLNKSPGTANVAPGVAGSVRVYSIEPGGGAQHADLTVDESAESVRIHVFWS